VAEAVELFAVLAARVRPADRRASVRGRS
jgi:hypothetical protein